MPFVTIIVPFWNTASTLSRCITSILQQTFIDWELLLIDDGSTDESYKICKLYEQKDVRIHLLQNEHAGVAAARNLALSVAKGIKVCFVDADDTIEPNYLKELISYPAFDLVICGYMVDEYNTSGELISSHNNCPHGLVWNTVTKKDVLEDAFSSGIMHINCNKLYNLSLIRKYDLHYKPYDINEDFIFALEYLLHTNNIAFVSKPLYHWIRVVGKLTGVNSIPQNILKIYELSHLLLISFFQEEDIANRIAYRSYDMMIYKYFNSYRSGLILRKECFEALRNLYHSEMVKKAYAAYIPRYPLEKIFYVLHRLGLFQISFAMHTLILKLKKHSA